MAADIFLKIDTIDGESTDQAHKNEIELESFSWSGSNASIGHSSVGQGMGTGKVDSGDLSCSAPFAKDTPKLFAALCSGTHIPKAVLTLRKSGGDGKGVDYASLSMSEIAISNVSIGGGSNSVPQVSFAISFSKLEWQYKAQDAKGNVSVAATAGWDFKKNVKV